MWPAQLFPVIRPGEEEVAVEAMKAGLDEYILKSPRHFAYLTAAVRKALRSVEECLELR